MKTKIELKVKMSQRSADFEWLRKMATSETANADDQSHAQNIMLELVRLNKELQNKTVAAMPNVALSGAK